MKNITIKEIKPKKYSILDALCIPINLCPMLAMSIMLLSILIGIIPSVQILAVAKFIDWALLLVSGKMQFIKVLFLIIAIILLIAITWLSQNIKSLLSTKLELELRKTLRIMITRKRAKLKYHYVENPDTWDLIGRVSDDIETRMAYFYTGFLDFIGLCLSIVGLMGILLSQMWQAAIAVVIISIPLFFISLRSGKENYKAKIETQKYHRRHEYLAEVLSGRDSAQERVLFEYGDTLSSMWHCFYEKSRTIELVTKAKWFVRSKFGGLATTLVAVLVTLLLIHPVLKNIVTIGMFISLVNATYSLVDTMSWSLSSYVEQIADTNEYMREFQRFANLEEIEDSGNRRVNEFENIEFLNVKFKYPGTENYVLNGFTYRFDQGLHYALVGVNGAGKSTIIKLLTGLYDDYEGKILLNGIDIKEYSKIDLSRMFATIYQDYARYSISVKDNILVGNLDEYDTISEDMLDSIADKAGLNELVEQIGFDTKLGKIDEEGQDISGGQWQKIAIARILISKAPVCILDEPTSALDPISECELYCNFHNLSMEKTVVMISHRLGSTKLANRILVLRNGQLAEDGTHEQLIDNKGIYATMYESQRRWYGD